MPVVVRDKRGLEPANNTWFFDIFGDPSVSPGLPAGVGSWAKRFDAPAIGDEYEKTGASDTAWTKRVDAGALRGGLLTGVINVVEDYGAVPADPGDNTVPTTDSTAAFQAAIDACISSESHITSQRRAKYALYVPRGWYRISGELKIRSVVGFYMFGAGMQLTKLYGVGGTSGSPNSAIIGLNGGQKCKFEGFSLEGEGSAEYKYLWWSKYLHVDDFPSDPDRVALGCSEVWFDNVEAVGRYRNAGFKVGNDSVGTGAGFGLNRQTDQHHWQGCRAYGQYAVTSPSATHWQAGWEVGTGAFSNPVIYTWNACTAAINKYGVRAEAADLLWRGGNCQTNYADFYVSLGVAHVARIEGTRSEESGYFLKTSNTGSMRGLSISNIDFGLSQTAGQYDPDSTGFVIDSNLAGPMTIENFSIFNARPGGKNARIRCTSGSLTVNGLTTPHEPHDAFSTSITWLRADNIKTYYDPSDPFAANGEKYTYGSFFGGSDKATRQRGIVPYVEGTSPKARIVPQDSETWQVAGNLQVNGSSLRVGQMAVPGAPTLVSNVVEAGSYTYYLVCYDAHGRTSGIGASATIANGPNTLSVNAVVYISAPAAGWPDGAVTYDVYKTNTSTRLASGIPIERRRFVDYGQATSAVTAPTTNVTGGQVSVEPYANGNSGAALTIDWNRGNIHTLTLTANCTLTLSNPLSGGEYYLEIRQDATGSRLVTWPAAVTWPGGTAPTLTVTANKTDVFKFVYNGTNYRGSTEGLNY